MRSTGCSASCSTSRSIDSGGVEARPEHFNVGELFRKLQAALRADRVREGPRRCAFAASSTTPSPTRCWSSASCATCSANAIRYTDDGGVLVAARRRGERLLLQVWDSGVGIGERERERIFDEFYQVAERCARSSRRTSARGSGSAWRSSSGWPT